MLRGTIHPPLWSWGRSTLPICSASYIEHPLLLVRWIQHPSYIPRREPFVFHLYPRGSWSPSSRCPLYFDFWGSRLPSSRRSPHIYFRDPNSPQNALALEVFFPSSRCLLSLRSRFPPLRSWFPPRWPFTLEVLIFSLRGFHLWNPNLLLKVPLTSKSFSPRGSDSLFESVTLKSWSLFVGSLYSRSWFPSRSPLLPSRTWSSLKQPPTSPEPLL